MSARPGTPPACAVGEHVHVQPCMCTRSPRPGRFSSGLAPWHAHAHMHDRCPRQPWKCHVSCVSLSSARSSFTFDFLFFVFFFFLKRRDGSPVEAALTHSDFPLPHSVARRADRTPPNPYCTVSAVLNQRSLNCPSTQPPAHFQRGIRGRA